MPFHGVNVALVGHNLFLLYSRVPHVDPESSFNGSDSNVQGVESGQILSTRSTGFNISFKL